MKWGKLFFQDQGRWTYPKRCGWATKPWQHMLYAHASKPSCELVDGWFCGHLWRWMNGPRNSSVQCLSNIPHLREFFLDGTYKVDKIWFLNLSSFQLIASLGIGVPSPHLLWSFNRLILIVQHTRQRANWQSHLLNCLVLWCTGCSWERFV